MLPCTVREVEGVLLLHHWVSQPAGTLIKGRRTRQLAFTTQRAISSSCKYACHNISTAAFVITQVLSGLHAIAAIVTASEAAAAAKATVAAEICGSHSMCDNCGGQTSPGLVEMAVPLVSQAVGLGMKKSCLADPARHESHQSNHAACLPGETQHIIVEFCHQWRAKPVRKLVRCTFSLRLRSVLACLLKICSSSGW